MRWLAENHLSPGPDPARLGVGQRSSPKLGSGQSNTMMNLPQIGPLKRRRLDSLLGLTLDGSRLEGVVLRRMNGALQPQQTFSVSLSLDPLTAEPELVG